MRGDLSSRGFTLLEVILALGIFATAMTILLGAHSRANLVMKRSRNITDASMLAMYKIREIELSIEKDIAKGEFVVGEKEESGDFSDLGESFKDYAWRYTLHPVEIPLPPEPSASAGGEEAAAASGGVYQFMKVIADAVSKSTMELSVVVWWDKEKAANGEIDKRKQVALTTHIVVLK